MTEHHHSLDEPAQTRCHETVVIFKEEKQRAADRYRFTLESHGYHMEFVQVLQLSLIPANVQKLSMLWEHIHQGQSDASAVILTSPRAVDALAHSLHLLRIRDTAGLYENVIESVTNLTWFALGFETRKALLRTLPGVNPMGEGTTCAVDLANVIIQHAEECATAAADVVQESVVAPQGEGDIHAVFLCGDPRRDTLPNALSNAKVKLTELCVYESSKVLDVELPDEIIDNPPSSSSAVGVFFSPRGVQAVDECLTRRNMTGTASPFCAVIAIGKSTAKALSGVSWGAPAFPLSVASSPSAEGVLDSVIELLPASSPKRIIVHPNTVVPPVRRHALCHAFREAQKASVIKANTRVAKDKSQGLAGTTNTNTTTTTTITEENTQQHEVIVVDDSDDDETDTTPKSAVATALAAVSAAATAAAAVTSSSSSDAHVENDSDGVRPITTTRSRRPSTSSNKQRPHETAPNATWMFYSAASESWLPFRLPDALRIEATFLAHGPTTVLVDHGRRRVDLGLFLLESVYWESEPSAVRRATWFLLPPGSRRSDSSSLIPLPERVARDVEAMYQRGCAPSGSDGAEDEVHYIEPLLRLGKEKEPAAVRDSGTDTGVVDIGIDRLRFKEEERRVRWMIKDKRQRRESFGSIVSISAKSVASISGGDQDGSGARSDNAGADVGAGVDAVDAQREVGDEVEEEENLPIDGELIMERRVIVPQTRWPWSTSTSSTNTMTKQAPTPTSTSNPVSKFFYGKSNSDTESNNNDNSKTDIKLKSALDNAISQTASLDRSESLSSDVGPTKGVRVRGRDNEIDEYKERENDDVSTWEQVGTLVRGFSLVQPAAVVDADDMRRVSHLVLVVHGIGEALWAGKQFVAGDHGHVTQDKVMGPAVVKTASPGGMSHIVTSVDNLRERADRLRWQSRECSERVEFLPIQWHKSVRSEKVKKHLQEVSLRTVPKLRYLINQVLLDVVFYTMPETRHLILEATRNEMNRVVRLFKQQHPDFEKTGGKISVFAHSLGSVISWDLLSRPSKGEFELEFRAETMFAVGSPVAVFETAKAQGGLLGQDYELARCNRVFNVYHPHDPIAYRMEPMLSNELAKFEAEVIKLPGMGDRLHRSINKAARSFRGFLSRSLPTTFGSSAMAAAAALSMFSSVSVGKDDVDGEEEVEDEFEEEEELESGTESLNGACDKDKEKLSKAEILAQTKLNKGRAVDYKIQESTVSSIMHMNMYLSAVVAHSSYWGSEDVARFVLQQIGAVVDENADAEEEEEDCEEGSDVDKAAVQENYV